MDGICFSWDENKSKANWRKHKIAFEEDIDYSDIHPLSDNVIVTPIGWKFTEIRRRNLERMNAEKANAL